MQKLLCVHWKPYMNDLSSITCDATCYESDVRYLTDIKLLWEAVDWSYPQLKSLSKQAGRRTMRTKKIKWTKRYVNYSKMRRKTKRKARPLTRGLLNLLKKINGALFELESLGDYSLVPSYIERRATNGIILSQQTSKFYEDINPSNRIVSIDKPYLRPIVRGKEIKKVEFGAKGHKLQIDGISFIEYLSYDAFNEGIRLEETIYKAQQLTNTKVKIVGADAIYATSKNRKFITKRGILTDFKIIGRVGKHDKHKRQIAKMITKERASRLEGSFGTDKEYFLLNRIKARTKATETFWIFIGIHTSNTLQIGRRMTQSSAQAA
jgi:hypothetical protein